MMKLDTIALVETPEGIDLQAELVGLVPRSLAYSIDFLIRLAVLIVVGILLAFLDKAGEGLFLILFFVLEWWYPVFFEVFKNGQTPGKKAFDIKVVNDDLTPISFGASLTRNLLRTADLFPSFYVLGALSITVTRHFQRLGDLAAGTLVVYVEQETSNTEGLSQVSAVAPQYALGEDQQAAFINFALNRGRMSVDRQNEIAEIIRPRLPLNADAPADYVRGVGKWLLGAKMDGKQS